MAKSGDELVNPVTGLRTVFRKTARDTDGELLQVDWIGEPGWTTGPDHVHPLQEERFEVLSGKLGLRVEGVERVYGAGEVIQGRIPLPLREAKRGFPDGHVTRRLSCELRVPDERRA
jgi:hypothetical protein